MARLSLSQTTIPRPVQALHQKMVDWLKEAACVSVTADIWKDRNLQFFGCNGSFFGHQPQN